MWGVAQPVTHKPIDNSEPHPIYGVMSLCVNRFAYSVLPMVERPQPQIDFTKIDFPSDGLTVGTLRRVHPEQIDTGDDIDLFSKDYGGAAGDHVTGMLGAERDFATAAFNRALGIPPPAPLDKSMLEVYIKSITDDYIRYGIATGPHHAEQLVRGIESQATEQARQRGGRRP
jgi:hypothetical protein